MNEPLGVRTYIPEPKRKTPWKWRERPAEQQRRSRATRRRVRGVRGKRLQRLRSELTERSFAHVCETGGARRCWLHGMVKVTKRYLLQVAARNLGLIMRKLFGMGTPRGLQPEGDASSLVYLIHALLANAVDRVTARIARSAKSCDHRAGKSPTPARASRPPPEKADFQRAARGTHC